MKGKNLLIALLGLAFVIGVVLIITLFIPALRRPVPPVPQVQVTVPVETSKRQEPPTKPYVFEKASSLFDPFTSKVLEATKLQEQMELKNTEIELLKLELEKLRLEAQIDSLRKEKGYSSVSFGGVKALAISGSAGNFKVLLDNGVEKRWVSEGGVFDGHVVLNIESGYATLRSPTGKILKVKPGE
uniref:Uncharacterized protein n=1 Tax=candidate division WOR-3 bacterium TaxID=2052148 RepID=A0A7C2K4J4_UNCW3